MAFLKILISKKYILDIEDVSDCVKLTLLNASFLLSFP